ncbi:MAG: PKD domain-containing protein [Bacteroidales bacterium]|nr:PKD domain-containing protein [Bacteroidales bacterium]
MNNSVVEYSQYDGVRSNSSGAVLRGNMFSENGRYGVYVNGSPVPDLGQTNLFEAGLNSFVNNDGGNIQLYNNTSLPIEAWYNDWGHYTEAEIDAHIYDDDEDLSKGQVHFNPWYDPASLPLVVSFGADTLSGEAPLSVQFTDSTLLSPIAWAWDFENDGVYDATDQNPQWMYFEGGSYSVKLKASNATATDSLVKTDYITVTPNQHLRSHALGFDGQDDYAQVNNIPYPEDLTVEAWFKPENFDNYQEIVFWYGASDGVQLRLNTGGTALFGESAGGNWNYVVCDYDLIYLSQWNHIAATKQGDQVNLYINGVRVATGQFDNDPVVDNMNIGARGVYGDRFFEGLIDEVRIWSVVRSQSELQASMTSYLAGTETGLQAYFRFNDVAGQVVCDLTGNGYNGILGATNAPDIDDPVWTPTNWPYEIYLLADFSATPVSGIAPMDVQFEDFSMGTPTSWQWDFDSDGNIDSWDQNPLWNYAFPGEYSVRLIVSDSKGSDTITRYNYIAAYSNGLFSCALDFDGMDDYLNCGHDATINLQDSMTFEAWIKPEGWGEAPGYGFGRIFDKNRIKLFLIDDGSGYYHNHSLCFGLHSGGISYVLNTPENSISLNVWQHIAATYDGNGMVRIFINGIDQTVSGDAPQGAVMDHGSDDLYAGESAGQNRAFDGLIDELRFWNVVRDQNDIQSRITEYLTGSEQGLVGYWRMNDVWGQTATDLTANHNDGQLGSTPDMDDNDPAWVSTNWPYDIPLTADFSASPLAGNAPLVVQFTDYSMGNPASWEWDFNFDEIIDSYDQNPVWTYTTPGVYTVTLTVNDSKTSSAKMREFYIEVTGTPQPNDWVWVNKAGSASQSEQGRSIVTDDIGNSYILGYYAGDSAVFGNTTLYSTSLSEAFVAKIDPDNNWLWAFNLGPVENTWYTDGFDITLDPAGNIYIAGRIGDKILIKLYPDGTEEWSKSFTNVWGAGVVTDYTGHVLITGKFKGTATFGSHTITSTDSQHDDIFIAKSDANGMWFWAYSAGGVFNDRAIDISVDDLGKGYITGYLISHVATFGSHVVTKANDLKGDIFVANFDWEGIWHWVKVAGQTQWDCGLGISTNGYGYSHVTGYFDGTVDFGPFTLTSSVADAFVAELGPDGTWLWAVQAGGLNTDQGFGIRTDNDWNSYITGNFEGTAHFGPYSLTCSGPWGDVFIAKLDKFGNWLWAASAGGSAIDYGHELDIDNVGNCYVTGLFTYTAYFGTHVLESYGYDDVFVAKFGENSALTPDFYADVTTGEAPLTVNFVDTSVPDPISWQWDFENDGTIDSYQQNPQWTYNTPGSYSVKLVVSNVTAIDSLIKTDYINVTGMSILTIAEARQEPVGSSVTVEGIVTSGPEYGNLHFIQDATAGMALYGSDLNYFNMGDQVRVSGTLADYYGLLEMTGFSFHQVLSSGNQLPAAQTITINQMGEDYESEIVRIDQIDFVDGGNAFAASTNYFFDDITGSTYFRLHANSDLVNQRIPEISVSLTGICAEYNANPTSPYCVYGRDYNDLVYTDVAGWSRQVSGFEKRYSMINSMFAVDDSTVWATAYDAKNLSTVNQITRTTDGGTTWQAITLPGNEGIFNACICAVDAGTAWVAGFWQYGSNTQGIFATTDGGATWTHQNTAVFDRNIGGFPNVVYFWDSGTGVCMGDPTNGYFEIYATTDGGVNWSRVSQPNIPDPLPGEYGFTDNYTVTGNTIRFGTNMGRLFSSFDQGNTWSVVQTPLSNYFQVEFRDAQNGLILQQSNLSIYETSDGGANWQMVNYSGTVRGSDLKYVPGTAGTFVSTAVNGFNAGITISSDGGHTWEFFPETHGVHAGASAWVNAQTGWVGANNVDGSEGGVWRYAPNVPVTQLDLRVMLEGPFGGVVMSTNLNAQNYLPLAQPFGGAPWNYNGTESVASIPASDITDWVLVELRDAPSASQATGQTVVARRAGFLLKDGSIVDTDGNTLLQVTGLTAQNSLFAVIWHRNHVGVMTAVPLTETGGIYSYDFTQSGSQAYGGTLAHKQVAPGVWGMIAGDGNADSQIHNPDKVEVWVPQAGSGGYKSGDYNMNGEVNNTDKNDVWAPNTGLGGQVPQ